MRSLLFVPAHKEELIKKARDCDADALILDLEDSCPGDQNKIKGIKNIIKYANMIEGKTVFVRISDTDQLDLIPVKHIVWPKASFRIANIPKFHVNGSLKVLLLIETALGVISLHDTIGFKTVIGAVFGNEDYTADTLCTNYDFAQATIVNCAKAFNKLAIDSVNVDVHNLEKLAFYCEIGKQLGFDGKLCIHPKEIETIHKWYTPTIKEYEYSCRVIELYDQAERNGDGVAIIDGVYVAPPMVKYAQKIIKKYETYSSSQHKNNT